MGERLSITLRVFLPFRGRRTWQGTESVQAGATLADLLRDLALGEGDLAALINGRQVPALTPLSEGDEVAILRQSDGG